LCIIYHQAIISMNTRFELQQYDTLLGFLHNINTMRQLNDDWKLRKCYERTEHAILTNGYQTARPHFRLP
jgi:hypothetical protein